MPHSQYVAGNESPSVADRVIAHAFVIIFGAFALFAGVGIIVAALTGGEISRSLAGTHVIANLLIGSFLIAGSPVSIYGALNLPRRRKRGQPRTRMGRTEAMFVQMIGLVALAIGWLTYSITVVVSWNPYAVIAAGLGISVTLVYALLSYGLRVSIRRLDAQQEADRHLGG